MSFKLFDDTVLPKKPAKPEPKKNWNDPDIVKTELPENRYYSNFNSVFRDLEDQFKKSMWGIMNHCDNETQKTELKTMVEFLDELTKNTKEFIEKWEKAHENAEDED